MREINFLEVGMQNFGPYIDPMILSFDNDKVTMLIGPNGVGKTMSLDAIPYTLYGITSKGAKGDDVVNNKKKKDCHTWVKFKSNDDLFEVHRYQKFKSVGNTVILLKNGNEIKKGHKEVLPEIDRILCPAKTFMNTLMFGQKVKDFFTDLTDSDKKQIFRNLLGLDNYVLYYEQTKKQITDANMVVEEMRRNMTACEAIISKINNLIVEDQQRAERFVKEQQEKLVRIAIDLKNQKEKIKNLENELPQYENIETRLAEIKTKISSIVEKLSTMIDERDKAINDIKEKAKSREDSMTSELTQKANKIKSETMSQIQKIRNELKANLSERTKIVDAFIEKKNQQYMFITQLNSEILLLKNEIKKLEDNIEQGVCPTCQQIVAEERKNILRKEKAEKEESIKTIESKIAEHKKNFEDIQLLIADSLETKKILEKEAENKENELNVKQEQELNVLREQFKNAKAQINELRGTLIKELEEKYTKDTDTYQTEHGKLNVIYLNLQSSFQDYKDLKQNLENQKLTLASITTNYKHVESQKYDTQEQNLQIQLRNEESKLQGIHDQCDVVFRKIDILNFWKDAFSPSGIPSMLVDEAIPFMNRRISDYLDKLTNGRYIVSFDTLSTTKAGEFRDKISVNLLDTYTQANSRVQFSGGQTRIVDIATILTLGDLQANIQNVKINILLFDEIFDSLDSENIGAVAKVMNKIKEGKSIYIISHTHQEDIEVDETLMIGK